MRKKVVVFDSTKKCSPRKEIVRKVKSATAGQRASIYKALS